MVSNFTTICFADIWSPTCTKGSMNLSQNFIFWILPQPWSGTPLNERSIISATPNLITIYLATGNWKFILYRLRLEIQVIVLYNNKLCMFALLWQINTNLSWSTHFLLNGYLLIWYLCFLIMVRESWTCIKDTFSAILPLPWNRSLCN